MKQELVIQEFDFSKMVMAIQGQAITTRSHGGYMNRGRRIMEQYSVFSLRAHDIAA